MKFLGLLVVISILVFMYAIWKNRKPSLSSDPDILLRNIRVSPPIGSVLKVHEPIYVTFDYEYTSPNEELSVWAKILDETYDSTYEGSMYGMVPGVGEITRYVYLTEPGKVTEIHLVIKDQEYKEIHNQVLEVDYTFEKNEEYDVLAEDGIGSKILSIGLDVDQTSKIKAGTKVNVDIEYEINTENGLDIWVVPVTERNMSYEGSTGRQSGFGNVSKFFVVSEPCEVKSLKILMKNAASKVVFEQDIDVDLEFS